VPPLAGGPLGGQGAFPPLLRCLVWREERASCWRRAACRRDLPTVKNGKVGGGGYDKKRSKSLHKKINVCLNANVCKCVRVSDILSRAAAA
jgi:hypothetical protein